MTPWAQRSHEERALLNPAFCANLLWHAARGYASVSAGALPFVEAFLVLPFVLDRQTREGLPRTTRTSLAVWLSENPLARSRIADRASKLVPFTKEALLLGGRHRFLGIVEGAVHANPAWTGKVKGAIRESSDEVKECAKRAEFVGKWLADVGSASTVLAVVGVRP